jgi:hypothetical protein
MAKHTTKTKPQEEPTSNPPLQQKQTPPPAYSPSEPEEDNSELPGIKGLSIFFQWVEEIISALSGYILSAALALLSVDTFSNGWLSNNGINVDLFFAFGLTIGITGQLVGMSYRFGRAFRHKKGWEGFFFGVMTAALGYVEYLTATAGAYKSAFNTPIEKSLMDLGINPKDFIDLRLGVAVVLVVLSGVLRPVRTKKQSISAEEQIRQINERAQIDEAKRKANQQRLKGLVEMGKNTIAAAGSSGQSNDQSITPKPSIQSSTNSENHSNTRHAALDLPNRTSGQILLNPTSPELSDYEVIGDAAVEGYSDIEAYDQMNELAAIFGIAPSTFTEAYQKLRALGYQPLRPDADQPSNVVNVPVWHILAMLHIGLLKPSQVRNVAIREVAQVS